MSRALIAMAACAALSTLADSNTFTGRPGFFKPTPDGNTSISRIVPPPDPIVADTAETLPEKGTVGVAKEGATPPVARIQPPADERARKAEPELDRSEQDNRVAMNERDRAP
jgi:hypothetical protein